ncbi:MAG: cation transporter [Planctomycetota bacterium]|nr:cation transporter [Planctomycetota bacterium]MDW8373497.1 cation transporter [Planctomycetota bacterium]
MARCPQDTPPLADLAQAPWRRARFLARCTIAYNFLESGAALFFGIEDGSLALLGFGADSAIEIGSAALVLWRLRAGDARSDAARERRAARLIALLLVLLGALTIAGAGWTLASGRHPESTLPGALIGLLSLLVMAWLWRAKRALAGALGSETLRRDAACARGCFVLSAILLSGSALYAWQPALWWADAVAAIAIALLILREGWEGLRHGDGCGCAH